MPKFSNNFSNLLYHCLPDCLSPYMALFSLHTLRSFPLATKPCGCFKYMSCSISALRNAVLTSR